MAKAAYKNHRDGSRKAKVHQVFDSKGRDAALKLAKSLKLKDSTARTWTASWGRKPSAVKAKAAKAKAGKKVTRSKARGKAK